MFKVHAQQRLCSARHHALHHIAIVLPRGVVCLAPLVATNAPCRRCIVTAASAPGTAETARARPGEKKGFVEEMRFVAMRLHTKDQAPKEGGKEASKTPMSAWQPTVDGYLRFLTESKVVFDAVEEIVAANPEYTQFTNTGLERGAALEQDITWMTDTFNVPRPIVDPEGPGNTYATLLRDLATSDPPAFICHYYNIYFAHSAGGRMIGSKLSGMLLDGKELAFYQYEKDMKELLQVVRDNLNAVAESWSREEKDHCLEETEKSFRYSGALMAALKG